MTREDFEKQLDENHTDFALRAVYADWLEENKLPDESYVQRWLVHRSLAPYHRLTSPSGKPTGVKYRWAWYPEREVGRHRDKISYSCCGVIPNLVFDNIIGSGDIWSNKYYSERRDAEEALIDPLCLIRALARIT